MFGTKTFMLTVPLEASVLSYSRIYTLHWYLQIYIDIAIKSHGEDEDLKNIEQGSIA